MVTKHRLGRWLRSSDDNDNVKNSRSDVSQESALVTCSAAGDDNGTANVTGTDTDTDTNTDTDAKKQSSPHPSVESFNTFIIKNNISDNSTPNGILRKSHWIKW